MWTNTVNTLNKVFSLNTHNNVYLECAALDKSIHRTHKCNKSHMNKALDVILISSPDKGGNDADFNSKRAADLFGSLWVVVHLQMAMFNSLSISVDVSYFTFCWIQQIWGLKEACGYTDSEGAERPHDGAGLISTPREEAQDMKERERDGERLEKTDAVSSVYIVTALIFYRLLWRSTSRSVQRKCVWVIDMRNRTFL